MVLSLSGLLTLICQWLRNKQRETSGGKCLDKKVSEVNDKYDIDRSTGENVRLGDLPKRCFISHSYQDKAAIEKLRRILPEDVEPVIFPRLEPDPRQAVSDKIIPEILACRGLIYLTGGFSSTSFWVAFERDYALRSGRKVFSFDPESGSFHRDRSAPIDLDLIVMFHQYDEERVRRLISWMAKERYFELDENNLRSTLGGFTGDILAVMEGLLTGGGVVLWLMGALNTKIANAFYSDEFVDFLLESESDTLYDMWKDCLVRLHEEDGDHDWSYDGENEYYNEIRNSSYSKRNFIEDLYSNVDQIFARIEPEFSSGWRLLPWGAPEIIAEGGKVDLDSNYRMIDLYEGMSGNEFNWNRIDDLIIGIYEILSDEWG